MTTRQWSRSVLQSRRDAPKWAEESPLGASQHLELTGFAGILPGRPQRSVQTGAPPAFFTWPRANVYLKERE